MGRTSLQEKRLRFFERGNTHCPICLTPFTEPDVRAGDVTLEHAPQHFPMVGWPWSASLPLRRLNGRPATPAEEDTMNQPARTARPPPPRSGNSTSNASRPPPKPATPRPRFATTGPPGAASANGAIVKGWSRCPPLRSPSPRMWPNGPKTGHCPPSGWLDCRWTKREVTCPIKYETPSIRVS